MYADIFKCTQCHHSKVNLDRPKLARNVLVIFLNNESFIDYSIFKLTTHEIAPVGVILQFHPLKKSANNYWVTGFCHVFYHIARNLEHLGYEKSIKFIQRGKSYP